MSDPIREVRSLSPWIRVMAGVLTIPCLAYGLFLAVNSVSYVGVGSKVHGAVIISFGLLIGRFALNGKTGLPVLDEAMESRDEDS